MLVAVVMGSVAFVAFALFAKPASAAQEPAVPDAVVSNPAVNAAGDELGSPGDVSDQRRKMKDQASKFARDNQRYLGSSVATGAALGAKLGSVVPVLGTAVGAVVGAVLGLLKGLTGGATTPTLQEVIPRLPPEAGLPYRPDQVQLTDFGVRLFVPAETVRDGSKVLEIGWEHLKPLFPGEGAIEACARSGMFAWRPFDYPTPFSEALNNFTPWLRDYEAEHIRRDVSDYRWNGTRLSLFDMVPALQERGLDFFDTEDGAVALLLLARRIAAWSQMEVPGPPVRVRVGDTFAGKCCLKEPVGKVLLETRALGWHLGRARAVDQKGVAIIAALMAGAPVLRPNPRVADTLRATNDGAPDMTTQGFLFEPFSPALAGFPGAWRFSLPEAVPTKFPGATTIRDAVVQANTEARAGSSRAPVRIFGRGRLVNRSAPVPSSSSAPAAGVSSGRGGAVLSSTVPRIAEKPLFHTPAAPPPDPDAFLFDCWIPGEGHVSVSSAHFVETFGNSAGVRTALERGQVAWRPTGLPAAVHRTWQRLFPRLEVLDAKLRHWRPFHS